jgi:hypothetical protein
MKKAKYPTVFLMVFVAAIAVCKSQVNTFNQQSDWLINNKDYNASISVSNDGNLVLCNGLVKRTFRLKPNVVCIGYENMVNSQQLLRAVKPEAELIIDGKKFNIGGLHGQKEQAYLLPEWTDSFSSDKTNFQFISYSESSIEPKIKWKQTFWAGNTTFPSGKMISFLYKSDILKDIEVIVNYELYDGMPLIVKWLSINNMTNHPIQLGRVINEKLALVEEESAVIGSPEQMEKQHGIYFETNYAFNNAMRYDISDQTTHWKSDSLYTSQVNYNYQTPCLLEIYPEKATKITLQAGEVFNSVRTHELLLDSYDRERRGLAVRKMYRTVAPWTTENPIFMHLVSRNDEQVKNAIDQCAETGYEALILSFGSHCNIEDTSAVNIAKWKQLAQLAHQKGIKIGGYSLFSSRRISDEDDVIDPVRGKPDGAAFFGHAPCLGSKWGLAYINKLKYFMEQTGFDLFENDGPYPGDVCASTTHPGHEGLADSQWRQMELQKELYHWCNEHGIYVNAPDWYFLDGTNKIALGYREVNFSLSRDQQKILNRQNIFDGTWEKTPSMGWGFVPLTAYHGGGKDAILEPLSEHLKDYEQLMVQYYGAGIQACYRGPRLFDTEETKRLVIKTIDWYKKYRDILNADLIHLRRADGRDWDGFLHVNPNGEEKGLLVLFNPLKEPITRILKIPVYYTGLSDKVMVQEKDGETKAYLVDRDYMITLTVTIPSKGYNYFILK